MATREFIDASSAELSTREVSRVVGSAVHPAETGSKACSVASGRLRSVHGPRSRADSVARIDSTSVRAALP